MRCINCGQEITKNDNFCKKCGQQITVNKIQEETGKGKKEENNDIERLPIRICSKCRQPISASDKFCKKCGQRNVVENINELGEDRDLDNTKTTLEIVKDSPKSKRLIIPVLSVVAVGVIIIICIITLFSKNGRTGIERPKSENSDGYSAVLATETESQSFEEQLASTEITTEIVNSFSDNSSTVYKGSIFPGIWICDRKDYNMCCLLEMKENGECMYIEFYSSLIDDVQIPRTDAADFYIGTYSFEEGQDHASVIFTTESHGDLKGDSSTYRSLEWTFQLEGNQLIIFSNEEVGLLGEDVNMVFKPGYLGTDGYYLQDREIEGQDDTTSESIETEEDYSDWKSLYVEYINMLDARYHDLAVVYIDNDQIPELIIPSSFTFMPSKVCWVKDGIVKEKDCSGTLGYIEQSGRIVSSFFHSGRGELVEYQLSQGDLTEHEVCSWGDNQQTYNWDGRTLNQDEFQTEYENYTRDLTYPNENELKTREEIGDVLNSI